MSLSTAAKLAAFGGIVTTVGEEVTLARHWVAPLQRSNFMPTGTVAVIVTFWPLV